MSAGELVSGISWCENLRICLILHINHYAQISIMLNASTFLAWGVSEVNDVIEHERMLRGKSYCSAKEETPKYPTWCWWHAQMKAQVRHV